MDIPNDSIQEWKYSIGNRFWATKQWIENQAITERYMVVVLDRDPLHETYLIQIVAKDA